MNINSLRHLRRKLQTIADWSLTDRLQIPLVWGMLGLARLAILTLPLRWYAPFLGCYAKQIVFAPVLTATQQTRCHRIRKLVSATAKYTPWESKCLVRALVAATLLRQAKTPYILHFGVAKNDSHARITKESMRAHAWVTAGSIPVSGGHGLSQYVVVGSYVSPLLASYFFSGSSLGNNNF